MIVVGWHPIEEALRNTRSLQDGARSGDSRPGATLLVAREGSRVERLVRLARDSGVRVERVAIGDLDRLADRDRHRGAVLTVPRPEGKTGGLGEALARGDPHSLLVLLDGVTDPRNLGAVIRSADQFAVDAVVVPRRRAAGLTQAVRSTSAGASEWVPLIQVANLARAIEQIKEAGYWVYGADCAGEDAPSIDLTGKVALVMGGEGSGLHQLVRRSCDRLVRIPTEGHIDSLNVSVATAILMYEVRRQQAAANP